MLSRTFPLLGLITLSLAAQQSRAGQCNDWRPGPFETLEIGTPGAVFCSTTWDPDDAGPLPQMLFVGGAFFSIGGVEAYNIAAWDGASWRPLIAGGENGIPGLVEALEVYNGDLIVGGTFTSAGGGSNAGACNNIARWDGQEWHPLGFGISADWVNSLAVFNGELIAGGRFYNEAPHHIARWDGSAWHPLGDDATNGVTNSELGLAYADVSEVEVFFGELWVGGRFDTAGSIEAHRVARWNGSSWLPVGDGLGEGWPWLDSVYAMEFFQGSIYAVGKFHDGLYPIVDKINMARWNGTDWVAVGDGLELASGPVFDVKEYGGQLYAGGNFTSAAGAPGNLIARWNGTNWSNLGGFLDGFAVFGLGAYAGAMVVVGDFDNGGLVDLNSIGKWNGASWTNFSAPGPHVHAIANFGSNLIVGGNFIQSTDDGAPAAYIAEWDGVKLHKVGSGINAPVHAAVTNGSQLIVGGEFIFNGPDHEAVLRVAQLSIFFDDWYPMGDGFNNTVHALTVHNGSVYAAGAFTASGATLIDRIARWQSGFPDGYWEPLADGGLNGTVYALKTYNGFLYAGGSFTSAGGESTGGLARWNGSAWSNVGGFFNGTVYALEVHNNELVMAGSYPGLPGSPNIAKYNGSSYSTLGTGGTNGTVRSLRSFNGKLYVGGEFTMAGGVAAEHIAYWDGAVWDELLGGADNSVLALASFNGEVHAGGSFTEVQNGVVESPGWAKYHEDGTVWIAYHPQSAERPCGANFAPDCQPAAGYSGLQYQWRKDGVPLTNGPTGTGSTIVGAFGNFALINVSDADEGDYDCVITNCGGSDISNPATLTVTGECPPCIGDLNADNVVNVDDLLVVINAWGPCPAFPGNCGADIAPIAPPMGDGVVNVDDLLALINAWGACP